MSSEIPDQREMMEKWQAASTPGEAHESLQNFVGSWKTTSRIWMAGPDSEPVVSRGTARVRSVLDGRFTMEEMEADMPGPDGRDFTFRGLGMVGYDNFRRMYVSTWADNMSTHLLHLQGTRDISGRIYTFYGQMDEPMLDTVGRTIKSVLRVSDNDHRIFELYDLHASNDYKVIEISYERAFTAPARTSGPR